MWQILRWLQVLGTLAITNNKYINIRHLQGQVVLSIKCKLYWLIHWLLYHSYTSISGHHPVLMFLWRCSESALVLCIYSSFCCLADGDPPPLFFFCQVLQVIAYACKKLILECTENCNLF